MKLRLGTRGSDLALTQSRWVAAQLEAAGVESELIVISTSGDRSDAPSFGAIGPQGVFVREIETALLDDKIDYAVHSFKDLPTQSPDGLAIGAVPKRRDEADWLFIAKSTPAKPADSKPAAGDALNLPLAAGAKIGTASARRHAWVRHFRPDADIASLRGNVPTRLRRLTEGKFDAILLAGAGVERLNESSDVLAESLAGIERQRLDPELFVPAPAQGALAIQCRADDDAITAALTSIDDISTRTAVDLEREALALAEGGCDSAFGAWATADPAGFMLRVMLERDGQILRATATGPADTLAAVAMARLAPTGGRGNTQ